MATPRSLERQRTWTRQAERPARSSGAGPEESCYQFRGLTEDRGCRPARPPLRRTTCCSPVGQGRGAGMEASPDATGCPSPQGQTITCRRSAPGAPVHPPFSLFPSTPPPRTHRLMLSPWVGPMPRSLPLTPSVWWPENTGSATRVPASPLRTRISSGSGQKRSEFLLLCTEANPETSDRQSSPSRQAQLPRTSTGLLGSPGTQGQRADGREHALPEPS